MIAAKYPNYEFGKKINEMPWKAFCTLTTEYELSYYRAQKLAENMHKSLESLIKKEVAMYWVAEPYADFIRYHIHMLIDADVEFLILAPQIKKSWTTVSRFSGLRQQNRCDIREWDASKLGGYYVAKSIHLHTVNWGIITPN